MDLKRALDVVGSGCGLIVLSPLYLAAAAAIWATMGRPIHFKQCRIGLNGEPFEIIKLRTMREPAADEAALLSDDQRVTSLGHLLRSLSLDELPELWLVLNGKMSLVGPRPLLPVYLELYTDDQVRRHEVRPGLTGLAQVSGRQHLTLGQRLDLDIEYVDRRSTGLDLLIILRTIGKVLKSEGVVTGQSLSEIDDIGLTAALERGGGRR